MGIEAPTVICPRLIVPVDPSIDPKLIAPTSDGTTFTMRSVAPPVADKLVDLAEIWLARRSRQRVVRDRAESLIRQKDREQPSAVALGLVTRSPGRELAYERLLAEAV